MRTSEREPADSSRDKPNVIGGWLPSLIVALSHSNACRMNYDYAKRDYLLPKGCKDLIDALKHKEQQNAPVPLRPKRPVLAPLPPVIGELFIPEHTTVLQFACMLHQTRWMVAVGGCG